MVRKGGFTKEQRLRKSMDKQRSDNQIRAKQLQDAQEAERAQLEEQKKTTDAMFQKEASRDALFKKIGKIREKLCSSETLKCSSDAPQPFCYLCLSFEKCSHDGLESTFLQKCEERMGWIERKKTKIDHVDMKSFRAILETDHVLISDDCLDSHLSKVVQKMLEKANAPGKSVTSTALKTVAIRRVSAHLQAHFADNVPIPEMSSRQLIVATAMLKSGKIKYDKNEVNNLLQRFAGVTRDNALKRHEKKKSFTQAKLSGRLVNSYMGFDQVIRETVITDASHFCLIWSIYLWMLGYRCNSIGTLILDMDRIVSLNDNPVDVPATVELMDGAEAGKWLVLKDGFKAPYQRDVSTMSKTSKNKDALFMPFPTALLKPMLRIGVEKINKKSWSSYNLNREVRKVRRSWYEKLPIFDVDPLQTIVMLPVRSAIPEHLHMRYLRSYVVSAEKKYDTSGNREVNATNCRSRGHNTTTAEEMYVFHTTDELKSYLESYAAYMELKNQDDIKKTRHEDYHDDSPKFVPLPML